MTMQSSQKAAESVLRIGRVGAMKRFALVESIQDIERGLPTGIRRSWTYDNMPIQNADVEREFEIALRSFDRGAGFAFAHDVGTYNKADGFVASADGSISTWKYRSDTIPAALYDSDQDVVGALRGFLCEYGNSVYMFHGRYSIRYPVPSGLDAWDWTDGGERTDLGFLNSSGLAIVANRPVIYQGDMYVPMKVRTTDAPADFAVLQTQATIVTEVQTITISGTPTTGTFDMTYGPTTVTGLAFNITTAELLLAIQSIPGLQNAAISRAGAAPNYVYTVTLNETGAQLFTPGPAVASPITFTFTDTFDAGGVAGAVVTPGVTDDWDMGIGITAIAFANLDHPVSGPVLVKASGNQISINSADPMTAGDWGPGYEVGDSGVAIANLSTYGSDLLVWKADGTLWVFDSQAIAHLVTDLHGVGGVLEGANASSWFGHQYIPTGVGLWEWRPGAARIIGPEQDQEYVHRLGPAWGHVMGMAKYGDQLYMVVNANDGTGDGYLWQFSQVARSERMPLTPHAIFELPTPQDVIVVDREPGLAPELGLSVVQYPAGGALDWTNPSAASTTRPDTVRRGSDSLYASCEGPGVTRYLRGSFIGNADGNVQLPPSASVTGLEFIVRARVVAENRVSHVGTGPTARIEGTGNLVVSPHDDIQAGDVVLVVVSTWDANAASTPSGFTALSWGTTHTKFYWKVATDNSGYTVPVTARASGYAIALRGCDTTTPFAAGTAVTDELASFVECALTLPDAVTEYALLVHNFEGPEGKFVGPDQREWAVLGSGSAEDDSEFKEHAVYGIEVAPYEGDAIASGLNVRRLPGPESPFTLNQVQAIRVMSATANDPYAVASTVAAYRDGVEKADQIGTAHNDGEKVLLPEWTTRTFGAPDAVWGTTWGGQIETDDGFAIEYTITNGTVQVQSMSARIYYTGSGGTPESMLVAMVLTDSQITEGTLRVASLPRYGMTIASDPLLDRKFPGASFETSRYDVPGREILKSYRVVEFTAEVDERALGDGIWLEASIDDGEPFPLLEDATVNPALVGQASESGSYRFFFPPGSVGRHVRLIVHGGDIAMAAKVREIIIRGAYRVETSPTHTFVVHLREDQQFATGLERGTIEAQVAFLESLKNDDDDVMMMSRPDGRLCFCEVIDVKAQEVDFRREGSGRWIAVLMVRESPYA